MKVAQLCPTLCDPMDNTVCGILQARILVGSLTQDTSVPLPDACVHACSVAQSCVTLYDPMDYSLSGSSLLGIVQAWTLEWVAMPFSRGSSQPRNWNRISWVSYSGRQIIYHWATGRASWYVSEETEETNLERYMCLCVHCSIIYNIQDTEVT